MKRAFYQVNKCRVMLLLESEIKAMDINWTMLGELVQSNVNYLKLRD
jgi:hypothetical protein